MINAATNVAINVMTGSHLMYKTVILFLALISGNTMLYADNINDKQQVAPSTRGVELQSEGSLFWLHFDEDADTLWPALKNFWSNEGITLSKENPLLGYMETDWTKDLLVERFLSVLLSDQAPSRRERFRLRVERLPENEKGSRVFINHSSYGLMFDEEAVYSGYLPASPQLEIEMLSRLALYSGVTEEQADMMVSSFSVHELKAVQINDNQYDISVPGALDFVSRKLIRTLDRMNTEINVIDENRLTATFNKTPEFKDKDADWEIDDSSDLEASEFADAYVANDEQSTNLVYKFNLRVEKSSVIVGISNATGNTDNGEGLGRFSQTIATKLQAK